MIIPQANNNVPPKEFNDKVIKKLKEMLNKKKIPYVDSDDIFEKEKYNLTSDNRMLAFDREREVGHFTPNGYAYIAQGIKNKMEGDKVVEKSTDFDFRYDVDGNILFLANKVNNTEKYAIIPYDKRIITAERNMEIIGNPFGQK